MSKPPPPGMKHYDYAEQVWKIPCDDDGYIEPDRMGYLRLWRGAPKANHFEVLYQLAGDYFLLLHRFGGWDGFELTDKDYARTLSVEEAKRWMQAENFDLPNMPAPVPEVAKETGGPDDIGKAIGLLSTNPTLSDREVARRVGIKYVSKLTRSKEYQLVKERVKQTFAGDEPPRGERSEDGEIEAFE